MVAANLEPASNLKTKRKESEGASMMLRYTSGAIAALAIGLLAGGAHAQDTVKVGLDRQADQGGRRPLHKAARRHRRRQEGAGHPARFGERAGQHQASGAGVD